MAATEPGPSSGAEPLTADLARSGPRVSTRTLLVAVVVLGVLLLVSLVAAVVLLHQQRLVEVPVPSVSAIA